jgi:hypothetical protein
MSEKADHTAGTPGSRDVLARDVDANLKEFAKIFGML